MYRTDAHVDVAPLGLMSEPFPCRTEDMRLWFSAAPAELELAKGYCRSCPVQGPCLAGALARAEPWGVWGGEIFHDGVVIPVKRSAGRPQRFVTPPETASRHGPQ
jgi:WhiB family redox-sensing transcriptional regulator